eukprot:31028-Pelagococcus_subviridis.AAC.5
MRRAKSLRIGVHHANAVVWGPVYRTHLILLDPPFDERPGHRVPPWQRDLALGYLPGARGLARVHVLPELRAEPVLVKPSRVSQLVPVQRRVRRREEPRGE